MSYVSERADALELASSDLKGGLIKLEELLKLNSDLATAWEDVGNIRMKLELGTIGHSIKETLDIFEKALELDRDNDRIRSCLELCKKHQVEKEFYGKIEHNVLPFPIFPESQSADYLNVMVGNAFAIKSAIPSAQLEFITLEYLKINHANVIVEYTSPDKNFQINNTARSVQMPMNEALELLENNEQTYVVWNMRYREHKELIGRIGLLEKIPVDEYWLDSILPTDELRDELLLKTHWYQMLIGSKDAGMFNHRDGFQNSGWHLHIMGSKRWHICHPDNSVYIKKYTKNGAGETNCFSPNYDSHPEFRKVVAYLGEFTTGDVLYYPGQFWHQTHNVQGINITLTCSGADKSNYRNIIGCMKSCCSVGLPYSFSKDLCHSLEDVYAYWIDKYGVAG